MTALNKTENTIANDFVFTSESVSEGHPDKLCDQVSDAILDAYLEGDCKSRVACETLATTDRLIIAGEITSLHTVDIEAVARQTIKEIGYIYPHQGFDTTCEITNLLHQQEIALRDNDGAGDQGLMFGYACNQTRHYMPIPIALAHQLLLRLAEVRKNGTIAALMPDAKSQVTMGFVERNPNELKTIVISTHHKEMQQSGFLDLRQAIQELVVLPTIAEFEAESRHAFSVNTCDIKINPLGPWTAGGPANDTGLTGRKIIVDTYGGWAQHGGGAFSGKDATKVDRSAAYMARHISKSIVAAGLADECLIQFSFVIGESSPVSLMADTFNSGKVPDLEIEKIINKNFDLTVKGIIEYLDLRRPIYKQTASYGHFGRLDLDLPWERIVPIKF